MIAGLPQAPSQYNPLLNPRAALARRNEVLHAMEQQGKISASEYQDALGQGLGLDPGQKYNRIRQPYIFDLVKQELQDRYGLNTVQNGGLKVYTTIQPRLQAGGAERGRLLLGLLLGRRVRRRRSPRSTRRTARSSPWPRPSATRRTASSTSPPTPSASRGPRSRSTT